MEVGKVDLQATRVWSLFSNMDLNDPASSSTRPQALMVRGRRDADKARRPPAIFILKS